VRPKWKVEHIIDDEHDKIRVDFGVESIEMPNAERMLEYIAAAVNMECTTWKLTPAEALHLGAEIERVWRSK